MKAIVTTEKNGTRFFLTASGMATDKPEQAYGCIYSCDAQRIADNANSEPQWQRWGFRWEVAYMLHNGEITLGDSVTA